MNKNKVNFLYLKKILKESTNEIITGFELISKELLNRNNKK